jgi:uncharacterized protein
MKILLFGASGMIGSRIATEARGRGHTVDGVTRSGAEGTTVGDAGDASTVATLAAGHDAVVLSITPGEDGMLDTGRAVFAGLREAGVRRLVVVGGAGSLEVPPGVRLVDTPEFPALWKEGALAQAALLDLLREEAGDLEWTYISPAAEIAPGPRTGEFRRGGDKLVTDAEGNSRISAEDYAIGLVDELEKNEAVRSRITFAY